MAQPPAPAVTGGRLVLVYEGPVDLVNERRSWHYHRRGKVDAQARRIAHVLANNARRRATDPGSFPWAAAVIDAQMTSDHRTLPDPDAVAGVMKPIIDGIVDAGILPDDRGAHVRWIRYFAPVYTGARTIRVRVVEIAPEADGRLL